MLWHSTSTSLIRKRFKAITRFSIILGSDARLEIEYTHSHFNKLPSAKRTALEKDFIEMIRAETTSARKIPVTSEGFLHAMQEACDRVEEKLSELYDLGTGISQPRFVQITPSVKLTPRRQQAPKPEFGGQKPPTNHLR